MKLEAEQVLVLSKIVPDFLRKNKVTAKYPNGHKLEIETVDGFECGCISINYLTVINCETHPVKMFWVDKSRNINEVEIELQ